MLARVDGSLDTQEISGAQLPYRRRERKKFVIYIDVLERAFFSNLKSITGRNFEGRTLSFFLQLEAYLCLNKTLWFMFFF